MTGPLPQDESTLDKIARLLRGATDGLRGVDPSTGEADYWARGGLSGLMGLPAWNEGLPGPRAPGEDLSVPRTPTEGDMDFAMGFAGGITPKVGKAIRAYHGSPHDFDKFDLSKIGTGEGAQAYGHGLYFAESEGVAKSYRDALAKDSYYTPGGQMFDPQSQLQHLNVRVAARNNGPDLDATIARAQALLTKASEQTRPMIEHDLAVLRGLKDAGGVAKNPGAMYEVDINADPSRFLDWDKPLSEQGAIIRPELEDALHRSIKDGFTSIRSPAEATGDDLYSALRDKAVNWRAGAGVPLSQELSAATTSLRDAGIPGIKYLDQGSRGSGTGTSNYVVFDDSIISILRKYGLLPAAGLGAAAAGSSEADQ